MQDKTWHLRGESVPAAGWPTVQGVSETSSLPLPLSTPPRGPPVSQIPAGDCQGASPNRVEEEVVLESPPSAQRTEIGALHASPATL